MATRLSWIIFSHWANDRARRARATGSHFGQLAGHRSERASAHATQAAHYVDHDVAPAAKVLDAFDAVQAEMLHAEHLVGLEVDHRRDEIVLVREVVVHLRGADDRGFLNVLDGGPRDATLQHQFRGRGHDAVAGGAALRGQLVVSHWHHLAPFLEQSLQPKCTP
jgi:hypothetical protein